MKADMTPDTESQQLILDAVDRFLKTEVRPHVKRLEHADEYPHEIVEQMKQMGLFGSAQSGRGTRDRFVCRHQCLFLLR